MAGMFPPGTSWPTEQPIRKGLVVGCLSVLIFASGWWCSKAFHQWATAPILTCGTYYGAAIVASGKGVRLPRAELAQLLREGARNWEQRDPSLTCGTAVALNPQSARIIADLLDVQYHDLFWRQ